MDIVRFAIWKFRNVDGILDGMHASDVDRSRYVSEIGETYWLNYDMSSERVTITSSDGKTKMECGFNELHGLLKRKGMYHPRPMSERNMCTAAPE